MSDLRHDMRNSLKDDVSVKLTDATRVKLTNQFYINDSNDQYFDYYNYWAYKLGTSLVQKVVERLYSVNIFSWTKKTYLGRQTSDNGKAQKDYLCVFSTTLMLDVTKSVSMYSTYAHTENYSNEPLDTFSDNTYTFGVYYAF
jgi:hypothetical protein